LERILTFTKQTSYMEEILFMCLCISLPDARTPFVKGACDRNKQI
jgi:hypothetical protein